MGIFRLANTSAAFQKLHSFGGVLLIKIIEDLIIHFVQSKVIIINIGNQVADIAVFGCLLPDTIKAKLFLARDTATFRR